MIVTDSKIELSSSRAFKQFSSRSVATGLLSNSRFMRDLQNVASGSGKDTLEISEGDTMGELTYNMSAGRSDKTGSSTQISKRAQELADIRIKLLQQILTMMQGLSGRHDNFFDKVSSQISSMMSMGSGYSSVTTMESYYEETEMTTFQAQGVAYTADGREIDFGVDISMSRKYTQYTSMEVIRDVPLLDPLVINVGGGVTGISDQHFYFDLDSDGVEENIPALKEGSGFLSYDKNGDGIINDGSELFGASTGDGFGDLAKYDSDNNGWIDEADEIFDKLKVWFKDENGDDKLISLKEADVGAIYLEHSDTEFTMQGMDMMVNAMIRQTGVFLRESGGVGNIQQVDLAADKGSRTENKTSPLEEFNKAVSTGGVPI
ncbi:MAG: hypothetical protein K6A23_04405 [Butyrivibrio sp.]|nr:hypothetical protein [Butyrivibrio sp.]